MPCQYQPVEGNRNGHRVLPGDMQRGGIQPDRTLELRLFHHFTVEAHKALTRKDSQDVHLFRTSIPQLALSHEFLLDTILALSALHLEHLESNTGKSWMRTGLDYQDRALPAFNKALAQITPGNCEAVIICAMLMIVLVLAIPSVADGSVSSDPISEIVSLRNLLHGIVQIVMQSRDVLHNGELGPFFLPLPQPKFPAESQAAEMERLRSEAFHSPEQFDLHKSTLHALERLDTIINDSDKEHQEIYRAACKSLQECVERYLWDQRGILAYPLRTDFSIFTLLEQDDPMAKLFFVHYGVALHLLTDRWFAKDAGKRLVRALLPSFDTAEQKWVDATEWAKRSVGIED